jgi:hypothetical protein
MFESLNISVVWVFFSHPTLARMMDKAKHISNKSQANNLYILSLMDYLFQIHDYS